MRIRLLIPVAALLLGVIGVADAQVANPQPVPTSTGSHAAADPRPVIRLRVKNDFQPADTILPQIVEGRLISDLADMETFRTVGAGERGDFLLTCSIRNLGLASGQNYKVLRDAESGTDPVSQEYLSLSLDLGLLLEDSAGKEVYSGKLNAQASRELEISVEHTVELMRQEIVDRAAQRLERILRKKLKKLA